MRQEKEKYEIDWERLGNRVRTARMSKGLSQEQLAELCDCTPTHLSNVENGKVGVSLLTLFAISEVLGRDMDYFVRTSPRDNPIHNFNLEIAAVMGHMDESWLRLTCEVVQLLAKFSKESDI